MLPIPTEEKEIDINGFLKDLEKEIKKVDKEIYTAETLERLNLMWREYNGEDRLISSKEIAEKLKNNPPEEKIYTGFKDFDDIISGFRLKQVVVIAGATKNGKTSWAVEMTSRMVDQNPVWLPFEESSEELVQKFLDRGEEPPHFYAPERMSGNTMLWVEKKIVEAKAKFNSKVVFIDHLHFIVDFGENMSVQIGRTMRELKRIAKFWDVCIFLIAHLKKTKMEIQPELDDLRDSSFIAQEADTVMMVWRKTEKVEGQIEVTNEVNVSIQANRRTGKTGNVKFNFSNGKFLPASNITQKSVAQREYDDWK
jgi:replicative DNA helicase